jgi:hypothetical protein
VESITAILLDSLNNLSGSSVYNIIPICPIASFLLLGLAHGRQPTTLAAVAVELSSSGLEKSCCREGSSFRLSPSVSKPPSQLSSVVVEDVQSTKVHFARDHVNIHQF